MLQLRWHTDWTKVFTAEKEFNMKKNTIKKKAATPGFEIKTDHWAYTAVNKLTKNGIVDGFLPVMDDEKISRYEVAMILEKALLNKDMATTGDKILIDRLSNEFSKELKIMKKTRYVMPNNIDISKLRKFYYSQLVIVGDTLELAGQGGWNDDFEFPEKLTDEIDWAFQNVERILKSVEASWDDVFKVRSYHLHNNKVKFDSNIVDYTSKKFREYMPSHAPLWTCIGVPCLGDRSMRVEIEATALMPSK